MLDTPRRGRPVGRYEHRVQGLLSLIRRERVFVLTDHEIGELLRISPRQASNYIRSLKKRGVIVSVVKRYPLEGGWKTVRHLKTARGECDGVR